MSTILDLTSNHSIVENQGVITVENAGKFANTNALYFDGNSYINFPNAAASINNFPACIEAWVKSNTELQTHDYGIITKGRHNIGYNTFGLYWQLKEYWRSALNKSVADNTNAFSFQSKSITNRAAATINTAEFLASTYTPQWYHIALTIIDGGGKYYYKLYLNGRIC